MLEFWLPMPPRVTNNNKAHWAVGTKEKNKYLAELARRQETRYFIPPAPAVPICPARLEATFYFKNPGNFSDRDNRTARIKRCVDWLVREKYIAGDRDEQLIYDIPKQELFTGKEPTLCSLHLILAPA